MTAKLARHRAFWFWRLRSFPALLLTQQAILAIAFLSTVGIALATGAGSIAVILQSIFALSAGVNAVTAASELRQIPPAVEAYHRFTSDVPAAGNEGGVAAPTPTVEAVSRPAGIQAKGISFRYPNSSRPALSNVDFDVVPGEMVALVGANGSGKTTLIKVLAGLLTPDRGELRLNGRPYGELGTDLVHAHLGVLFQDYTRYNMTVRDAVLMGVARPDVSDEEIRVALERARFTDVLEDMPEGLDTRLGGEAWDGRELSGGQWQRLALARLYLRDAPIWLLDEPTASLDAETEAEVFASLRAGLGQRACVVVTHRLWTARHAHRIVMLAHGQVVQVGEYEELRRSGGPFAELFAFQETGTQRACDEATT